MGKPSKTQKTYRVAQKMVHSVLQLKSVVGVPFYFSRVLRNQNFEPETTSHFTDTLSESKMAQQRKTFHFVFCNTSKKIVGSAQQTAVTCSPLGPKPCFSWSWDWIRRLLGWELTNPFWGNVVANKLMICSQHCSRRCALSLLGRAYSVVNANGGYLED